jgi:hypothetical protein
VDRVDQWATEARPGFGERVDGLHHSGMRGDVEGVKPLADLVREVDLPLASHGPSIARSIPHAVGHVQFVDPTLLRDFQ